MIVLEDEDVAELRELSLVDARVCAYMKLLDHDEMRPGFAVAAMLKDLVIDRNRLHRVVARMVDSRPPEPLLVRFGQGIHEAVQDGSLRVRDWMHHEASLEIAAARAQGWRGRVYAWSVMDGLKVSVHVSRIEPQWPVDGMVGHVEAYEVGPDAERAGGGS